MSVRCLVHNELDAVISRVRNVAKLAPKGDEIQNKPETRSIIDEFVGETGQMWCRSSVAALLSADRRSAFRRQ
jgi:hypothetical protein